MNPRALVVASLAVLALLGLAWAAEWQHESFLKPAELENGFSDRDTVSGNLVPLTAVVVAGAGTAMALVLATNPWRDRALAGVAVFISTYVLIVVTQTAMFNYVAIDVARSAQFSVSQVIANHPAAPTVYLGPLVLIIGSALVLQAACRRLVQRPRTVRDVNAALYAYVGVLALAAVPLIILAVGSIRLMFILESADPDALGYLLVLPLSAMAATSLLVIGSMKAWHLGQLAADARLRPLAQDAWEALRRLEWAATATIVGLAFVTILLPPVPHPLLEAGRVFGLTARSHSQAQALLLILLVPWLTMHRQVLQAMADATSTGRTRMAHPLLTGFWVAAGVGALGAAIGTWWLDGSLWPWLFASLPLAIFALGSLEPEDALLPALLCAVVLWAIGNTITGSFALQTNSQLRYDTSPGMLALWRAMAILLVAWAVARAARARTRGMRHVVAWPLTMGLASSIGLVIFFEMSLSAWIIHEDGAEYVGIGTLMASLDAPVRRVFHAFVGLAAFVSGLAIARLERPEWFGRKEAKQSASPAPPAEAQA